MTYSITQPIMTELQQYEALFTSCLTHKDGILNIALRHLSQRRGKMMRPKLMLLCAKAYGEVCESVLHAAVAVELLHTASLVHDDIVDESDRRRGQKSVNALIDNKAAVLVGDYLLSTALQQAALTEDIDVNRRLAWLGQTLAEGELMQQDCTHAVAVDEEAYYEIIRRKTASLFAVCAELGAMLAGGNETAVRKAFRIGELIGMAFQMRDDMFDYYSTEVGKPTAGADLREGKLTLPVIHAVQLSPELLPLALKARRQEASEDEMLQLIDAAKAQGIDYTAQQMKDKAKEAIDISADFPEDIRNSIVAYIKLVAAREV